jgi:hypothetical protein
VVEVVRFSVTARAGGHELRNVLCHVDAPTSVRPRLESPPGDPAYIIGNAASAERLEASSDATS